MVKPVAYVPRTRFGDVVFSSVFQDEVSVGVGGVDTRGRVRL